MLLRKAIEEIPGLRYVTDQIDLLTAAGRRAFYALPFLQDAESISQQLNLLEPYVNLVKENEPLFQFLTLKLAQVKDIKGTLANLEANNVLDDIELFEIKSFAILADEIFSRSSQSIDEIRDYPLLTSIIEILDPEGNKVPSFYIFDLYSEDLAAKRKEIRLLRQAGNEMGALEAEIIANNIEDEIRTNLSQRLREEYSKIRDAVALITAIDLRLSIATLCHKLDLVKPQPQHEEIEIKGLFNPLVKDALAIKGKTYQPIDVNLKHGVCLITGANMAGKTVLLKSLALTQALFQFGFFVPATLAKLTPVQKILLSIGDEQSELSGLSSFAAEMVTIDRILKCLGKNKRHLVLIDEPARTTNPAEGKALVNALLDILQDQPSFSMVTSHYSGLSGKFRRLRVKGFRENKQVGTLTAENIADYLDYSLIEDPSEIVPEEAIKIATLLGIDEDLLSRAKEYRTGK